MYVSPKRNRTLYNPPLIFAYVTCCKSPDNYHALSHVYVDICPSIFFHKKETKPTDKASSRVSLRHLYYFTWKKNELVWLIPVTATVKANLKCCFSRETKIDGKVIK